MKIEPLPTDVRSYLRTGVAITSVTQCVEELVLNSLDAGATCVAVRVDLSCFKVQVVDNGSGVPRDQLNILGNRFCTSKCHALADLDHLNHFGYRGEALASIRDSCGILEITTRSKHSNKTYCKIFQNGKSLKVAESKIVRPSVGTTITIHELFINFPVRQKSMNTNYEIERIRETLEGIALIRSGISFTLRNDSTGQMILSTRKCNSINATFGQLYGTVKADMLEAIRGSKQAFIVQGFIGREGHQRKNLQFVYINGRLVKKSKIHKLLNKLLLNLPALKPKQRFSDSPQLLPKIQSVFVSPPKFSEVYPIYILEVKCPVSEYDITFEPAKTMVEFKDWETLLACIEEVTKCFLSKENVVIKEDEMENGGSEAVKKDIEEHKLPVISTDSMKDVLISKTVKKFAAQNNPGVVVETPDNGNSSDGIPVSNSDKVTETNPFKTPGDRGIKPSKAIMGLGKRKIGVDSDTEESGASVIEDRRKLNNTATSENSTFSSDDATSTTDGHHGTTDTSTSDHSLEKETDKVETIGKGIFRENDKKNITEMLNSMKKSTANQDESTGSKQTFENVSQCSLSRYRQSIGKFSGRQSRSINIDESLKKLDKIMPSAKQNSRTLFSSLQRFRRKVQTRVVTEEAKNFHKRNFHEENSSTRDNCEVDRTQDTETENASGNYPCETNESDEERINRNVGTKLVDDVPDAGFMVDNSGTFKIIKDIDNGKWPSAEIEVSPTQRANKSSQESSRHFKFSPCYDEALKDEQKKTWNESYQNENQPVCDTGEQPQLHFEENHKFVDQSNTDSKHGAGPSSFSNSLPCLKTFEDNMDYSTEYDIENTVNVRKRPCPEIEVLNSHEKQFKYSARPLNVADLENELNYTPNFCDIVCNRYGCDKTNEIHMNHEDCDLSQDDNDMQICDKETAVSLFERGENLKMVSNKEADNVSQLNVEIVNNRSDLVGAEGCNINEITKPDAKNELNGEEIDRFVESTQAFIPRLSQECEDSGRNFGVDEGALARTPESFGFTPKLQTESLTNTPGSTGFIVDKDDGDSINMACESDNREKDTCSNKETNNKLFQNNISEGCTEIQGKEDKISTDDEGIEPVTLSQLLKTPSQVIEGERRDSNAETFETETVIQNEQPCLKGFSFSDLFSQTLSNSNVSEAATGDTMNAEDVIKVIDRTGSCSECNNSERKQPEISLKSCTEKGDNLDSDIVVNTRKSDSINCAKEDENEDILWTDSPWDISNSSFNLKNEIEQDITEVLENCQDNVDESKCEEDVCLDNNTTGTTEDRPEMVKGETVNSSEVAVSDENTVDSLDVWYQRLDAGVTVPSSILQSKKPSDVVKRLHACRFSKESLKTVKVLGQLDKKFIVCQVNTEEKTIETDNTMLVLIDQHAAHERIRLEILTEEAFVDGVKGGKLAPFAVDPAYCMTFAENEVRTILSFQDGYLKLGIHLRQNTATSILISSVPACLVDKEKNNKIYWSTVQVLIREHIAVFMSTQVSYGVLPQTIHKVLCSLACHGAIKFGDRLSADECDRLIKDLSRCDLPFQCAHGRPSVMPLFNMDKLKSLSHSECQVKPSLWKLRQALKLQQEIQERHT